MKNFIKIFDRSLEGLFRFYANLLIPEIELHKEQFFHLRLAEDYRASEHFENDFILWAVPKSRRTVEVRRSRRIGATNYFCKLHPVKKLLTCSQCGNSHEVGKLCPVCYEKVMKVTESIKEAVKKSFGRAPIEQEFVPVFKGEKIDFEKEFYQGKRIVEVDEEKPSWFSKNLKKPANIKSSNDSRISSNNPLHVDIKS